MRALTSSEEGRYLAALEHLHDFDQTRDLVALVGANLEEVRLEIARFEQLIRSERHGALNQSPTDRRRLQRVVINFLNAVRLYLDHRQTHLTRRYGAESEPLMAFNESRRGYHGSVPEYAFVYELRNFVQHCGMPLQTLRANQSVADDGTDDRIQADVLVGCNRAELIRRFHDWTYSRAFIEAQPEEFPILPSLATMAECVSGVETATINALMPSLWADGQLVARLLAEGSDEHHIGLVADISPGGVEPGKTSIAFRVPPFVVLEWMRLLEHTSGPPGYRIITAHLALAVAPRVV